MSSNAKNNRKILLRRKLPSRHRQLEKILRYYEAREAYLKLEHPKKLDHWSLIFSRTTQRDPQGHAGVRALCECPINDQGWSNHSNRGILITAFDLFSSLLKMINRKKFNFRCNRMCSLCPMSWRSFSLLLLFFHMKLTKHRSWLFYENLKELWNTPDQFQERPSALSWLPQAWSETVDG